MWDDLVTISGQYGDPATVSTIYNVQTQTLLCDSLPSYKQVVAQLEEHQTLVL